MEVNCLALKDLISPRQGRIDFTDEDGESAQKENIFDRPRMTPKTPLKNEPIDLSKQKSCVPEGGPITPVKLTDRPLTEPWTPTANLKMLISAASPDMRDREKKKELFRPIENNEFNNVFHSLQCDAVDDGTVDEYEKQRPSRKQKSLGLLCQKFLARYPSYPLSAEKTTISLDEVASSLGVERRRIYDIVNVLESLDLVSRVAKNQYCWHGRHSLSQTLKNLQELGELQKYEELMAYFQHKELDLECRFASANSRKDKSLRIMSQKFVMLFLVSKTKIVTLDIAAKILIEESQDTADHSKFKTKVRRLYDIANVLTSLGLIKKVHVTEERGRKPAFKWIGPVEFTEDSGDIKMDVSTRAAVHVPRPSSANRKERLSRHASFNAAPPSELAKRKVNSEPSSPHRGRQDDYCSKMISLASVCCQKTEDDIRDSEYCLSAFPPVSSSASSDPSGQAPPNGIKDQSLSPLALAASKTETGETSVLPHPPFLYLPSPSLYMLCGNLQESLSRETLSEKGSGDRGKGQVSPCPPETPESNVGCRKRSSQNCVPSTVTSSEGGPSAKRQSLDQCEGPISLVVDKKAIKAADAESCPDSNCGSINQLKGFPVEPEIPAAAEAAVRDAAKSLEPQEQEKACRNQDLKGDAEDTEQASQESSKPFSLPQYLYVQPTAGLNGFNFLFPASQSRGPANLPASHLPSLNVPYMMVPSTALASFPVIYSPAVTTSQLSSMPAGSFPNVPCLNLSVPGLTSTTPVFLGTPAVVTPHSSPLPMPEAHQHIHSSVHLSPVLGTACGSVKADAPLCMGHPVALLKMQQPSSTPLTPKNMRPAPQEAFFKTPGSLEEPVLWRKSEGSQSRGASSAQRRLEISSNSAD